MGGWLPSWLRFGREHHLIHHDYPDRRYNVFLPLFRLVASYDEGLMDTHREEAHWSYAL
jgi:hypothetical protein